MTERTERQKAIKTALRRAHTRGEDGDAPPSWDEAISVEEQLLAFHDDGRSEDQWVVYLAKGVVDETPVAYWSGAEYVSVREKAALFIGVANAIKVVRCLDSMMTPGAQGMIKAGPAESIH